MTESNLSNSKIKNGLNKSGLFFEELVNIEFNMEGRFLALKEERGYSYKPSLTNDRVSGTADYVGFYYDKNPFHGSGTIFGIECKKVNEAKTWLFVPMKDDSFASISDTPTYILQMDINTENKVSRRSGVRTDIGIDKLTIKSYEMRDSGNVYNNNDEKIFNACRQAIRATNGFFLNDEEIGMDIFGRPNAAKSLYYSPLVVTNAKILFADIDSSKIDINSGELTVDEGITTTEKGWAYHVINLMPEERHSLSMETYGGERLPITPVRIVVPIVNINHIDDFLRSYRGYIR